MRKRKREKERISEKKKWRIRAGKRENEEKKREEARKHEKN